MLFSFSVRNVVCSVCHSTVKRSARSAVLITFQPFSSSVHVCASSQGTQRPFSFFIWENKEKIIRQLPAGSKPTDMFKLAGTMWTALAPGDKKVYVSKAREASVESSSMRKKLSALLKLPPSPEMLFIQSVERTETTIWHKHVAFCRNLWQQMPDKIKQDFAAGCSQLRSEREHKIAALTAEERIAFAKLSIAMKAKEQKKKLLSKFGRPKPRPWGFHCFYKTLTADTKTDLVPFYERGKADKEKYLLDLEAWKREMIEHGQAALVASEDGVEMSAQVKDSLEEIAVKYGKPKPAPRAFLLFMRTLPPLKKYSERAKLASQKWHQLPEAERQSFREEQSAAMQKYKANVETWREKMIENGLETILMQLDQVARVKRKKPTAKAKTESTCDDVTKALAQSITAP